MEDSGTGERPSSVGVGGGAGPNGGKDSGATGQSARPRRRAGAHLRDPRPPGNTRRAVHQDSEAQKEARQGEATECSKI